MNKEQRDNLFFEMYYLLLNENRTQMYSEVYEKTETQYTEKNGKRRFKNYATFRVCLHKFTKINRKKC